MLPAPSARGHVRLAGLLALILLGACGVGSVEEQTFVYAPFGPEGGVVDVGDVRLVIPPGALAQPTAVGVLPESAALPIAPPGEDPCTYQILGSQWCCGPRGLALLVQGRLLVAYDPALVPPETSVEDLVLLLWDPAQEALAPAEGAVHDAQAHTFLVPDYTILGHLAVGLRTCPDEPPADDFVFTALSSQAQGGATASTAPEGQPLYVGTADGSAPPVELPTSALPLAFIPSPSGDRVLYEVYVDDGSQDYPSAQLLSIGLEDTDPVVLAGDDEVVTSYDPVHGWMRDAQRVFFQEYVLGEVEEPDRIEFSTVPGDASAPPTGLYELPSYGYVTDVRQSPDGSMVLITYYGPYEAEQVDVFDAATGEPISVALIPRGGGNATPRWLPDSSGVYLVSEDQSQVLAYDPDGGNERVLYTAPSSIGNLKDFVLAPDGDDYACVGRVVEPSFATAPPATAAVQGSNDQIHVGSLSGGERGATDLGGSYYYDEMAFHPGGEFVFLDAFYLGLRYYRASDAGVAADLHAQRIGQVDVNALTGRLLIVVRPFQDRLDLSGVAQGLVPGVYVADADGANMTLVDLPAELEVLEARWLRSTRTAPCMGFVNRVR